MNEGYRTYYSDALLQAKIIHLAGSEDGKDFLEELVWAAKHPSDILNTDTASSSDADIKKLLGG